MITRTTLLRSKFFWVGLLYFAEGFPLGVFFDLFPVQFRQQGVSLSDIGLLSLLGLAWTLKFLWAPAIDHYRHHRRWMFAVDLGMGLVLLAFAIQAGFGPWVWVAIGLFTLLSATNDIAIDGYTIEFLERKELGLANGVRIGLYRVGMLAAGFFLVLSDWIGWTSTYAVGAILFLLLGLACLQAPRERAVIRADGESFATEIRILFRHPLAWAAVVAFLLGTLALVDRTAHWSAMLDGFWYYAFAVALLLLLPSILRSRQTPAAPDDLTRGPVFGALLEILQRPGMLPVLFFILVFKLGDAAMGFMIKPFWVDTGFTASQIGVVSVNLGLVLSVAGGVAGGWITDRIGIFRALWILGLCQAVSNLAYAGVASILPLHAVNIPIQHQLLMYGASGLESFTGGLGTAAFLAFLMAIVDKRRSATEYALLSSVFALSRSVAGWAGGYGAETMGYAPYFLLTFFLSFPAYLMLPWVRTMLARPHA